MATTLPENASVALRPMIGIETRRFARHPLFLVSVVVAYAVQVWVFLGTAGVSRVDGVNYSHDLLAQTIIPAFFIGIPALVVAAHLTRSTESATEAMGTAPATEAQRTLAVAGGCLVPFMAGVGWLVLQLMVPMIVPPHPNELWFNNVNDLHVWSLLIALGPVACLGGALLGVLVGRWLRFRGAAAVAAVVLVVVDMGGSLGVGNDEAITQFRVWAPWAMFHTGTMSDGKPWGEIPGYASALMDGNPVTYLFYVLVLCALAVGGAMWHDRTARTSRLRLVNWSLVGAAVVLYLLTAFTGPEGYLISGLIR